MKREDALKLSEKAISELRSSLEAGRSETLEKYLAMLGRFHRYSFGNVIMIYQQRPDATHVAGFARWKQMGRQVKKGEKGIAVLAPIMYRRSETEGSEDEGGGRSVLGFRVVHVFDVSQTEGEELPELPGITGDPGEQLGLLRSFVEGEGITLRYAALGPGTLGQSAGGEITIVPGLCCAEEFSVLVHETAHELLHRGVRRKETTLTIRETEAEAVAFVVAKAIGLDPSTRSSDYIQLYSGDVATLTESLDHIQKAATLILGALTAERALA